MVKNCYEPGIIDVEYVVLTLEMATGTPTDSVLRPTSLFRIHAIIIDGANTHVTT